MRSILFLIAKCRVEYEYWKWLFITTSRHVFGRWYVFRDAPLWFVRAIASTPLTGEDLKDERYVAYYDAAVAELITRQRK